MKKKSWDKFLRIYSISRFVFLSSIVLMLITLLCFSLNVRFLEFVGIGTVIFATIFLILSWTAPGIFFIVKSPQLAYAWILGTSINRLNAPWEKLPKWTKFALYFRSFLLLAFLMFGVILFIIRKIQTW
jgi:hypothetical protein